MRPTPTLLKGRGPFYEHTMKVPLNMDSCSLALKNQVSNRSGMSKDRPCLAEMSIVLQCFKDHDYKESRCADALSKLQKCYTKHKIELKESKAANSINKPTTDVRSSKSFEVNKLLRKYPTK